MEDKELTPFVNQDEEGTETPEEGTSEEGTEKPSEE